MTKAIKAFQEKPTIEEALSDTINTGIYLFEPEIFEHIPSGQSFDIGSDLFPKLVELGAPFYALPMDFEWVDIGKVPDYWQAIRSVLQGEVRQVGIPGKQVRPGSSPVSMSRPTGIGSMCRARSMWAE